MASQELKIKVSQVLQGGNALKETRKEVAELKAALFTLESQGKKNTAQYKQFEASLVSANGKLKAHNTEMKNLTGATNVGGAGMMKFAGQIGMVVAGVTVAIAAIVKLGTEILNLAKSGAEFNVLKKGFEELSGGSDIAAQNMELFRKSLAGNLSDAPIMKMANGFKLLGIDANTTAQVFDLAERNTELLGGTVEEVVEKMKKFVTTGTGKGFEKFGVNINDINNKIKEQTGLTEKQIKSLDDEERVRIGLNAFMTLHGKSIDEIKNKKMDEADAIQFLITQYENFKTGVASLISTALAPMIKIIQSAIEKFKEMFGGLVDGNSKFGQFTKSIVDLVQKGFEYFVNVWTSKVWPAYKQLFQVIEEYLSKNPEFIAGLKTVGKLFIDIGATIATVFIKALTKVIQAISWVNEAFKTLKGWIWDIIKAFGSLVPDGFADSMINHISKIIDWVKKAYAWIVDLLGLVGVKPDAKGGERETRDGGNASKDVPPPGDKKDDSNKKEKEKEKDVLEKYNEDLAETRKNLNIVNEYLKNKNLTEGQLNHLLKARIELQKKLAELLDASARDDGSGDVANAKKFILPFDFTGIQSWHRDSINLKKLNPRQKDIEQNEEIERLLNSAMNNFDGMVNATATMLQNLGLMETGFGQILNGVIQVINIFKSAFDVGSSIFGFIGDIISLLPGGGIAGGILKTVGGSSGGGFASGGQIFGAGSGTSDSILARLSNGEFIVNAESTKRNLALLKAINGNQQSTGYAYATGGMVKAQSMSPNITVVVNSEVESTKAIKFYQNTFDKYQSRLNKKRL